MLGMVRCHRKGEALPELVSNIRRLVARAYPNVSADMKEGMGRDYFIEALDLPEIRMQVRQTKPKTLSMALRVALEEEAFSMLNTIRVITLCLLMHVKIRVLV